MIIYNSYNRPNNFGFDDKSHQVNSTIGNQSRTIKRAASCSKKHSRSKLSAKNIGFLQSLGLKIKRK